MKVFWPFLPIFQRLLLLLALPFLSYINYCANGFLCYAVYVNHLLCSSSSKCPLVVKSWKLLNSFDMIWDGNKVLEKVAESSASSWTTHGVDAARTSMSSSVIQRSWSIRNEKHHSNCQIFSTLTTISVSLQCQIQNKECQNRATLIQTVIHTLKKKRLEDKCALEEMQGVLREYLRFCAIIIVKMMDFKKSVLNMRHYFFCYKL